MHQAPRCGHELSSEIRHNVHGVLIGTYASALSSFSRWLLGVNGVTDVPYTSDSRHCGPDQRCVTSVYLRFHLRFIPRNSCLSSISSL